MLKFERLERMEAYINQNKYVTIGELAEQFSISSATIRRDLEQLSSQNRVTLTRGGVVSNQTCVVEERPYSEKLGDHQEEKRRIAQAAASMVAPGSTIMVDSGTTNRAMIPFLQEIGPVNIVTNDVVIAGELTSCRDAEVTVLGGTLRKGYFTLVGHYAEDMVAQMRADIAFIGMDAVSLKGGCMIANMNEVGLKRAMIQAARQVVIVCDHSKFETESFLTVCPLEQADLFIVGQDLSGNLAKAFQEAGCRFQLV